jgi:hypothetical protein
VVTAPLPAEKSARDTPEELPWSSKPASAASPIAASGMTTARDIQLMSKHRVLSLKRNFDLNGEARTVRTKQSSPIIPPA